MKKQFTYISRSFKAEWIKIKGLGLIYTGIVMALITPLFKFVIELFKKNPTYDGFPISIFSYGIMDGYSSFGNFFLLLFIIVAASKITQSDHKNNGWAFIETQPLNKLSIYLGKFLTVVLLTTISIIAFYIFSMIFYGIMGVLFDYENITYILEWKLILHSFLRLWLLSLIIVSFQLMLSMIFKNFIWPFVIGGMSLGLVLILSINGMILDYLPYNIVNTGLKYNYPEHINGFLSYTEFLSLFGTLIFFVIGYVIYKTQSFKKEILTSTSKIIYIVIGIFVIVGGFLLITKPIHSNRDGNITSIQGTVNSNLDIDYVTVYKSELNEKITEIPVVDGKFKWEMSQPITEGVYVIDVKRRQQRLYLSTGDQINIIVNLNNKRSQFIFNGTRKADAQYLNNADNNSRIKIENMVLLKQHSDNPKEFYKIVQEKWGDMLKSLNKYRTYENIHLSKDFMTYKKQEFAIRSLNSINKYQTYASNESEFTAPQDLIDELNKTIEQPSNELYLSKYYKEWKMNQLLSGNDEQVSDSLVMAKLKAMPNGVERDRLLTYQMINTLKLTEVDSTRNQYFKENSNLIQNEKYQNYVSNQLSIINSQQRGSIVPDFKVLNKNGEEIELLKKYAGKYIIIDWWATWCEPCLEIRPAFEYQANRYWGNNAIFVSISIDQNKKSWELDIKNNRSNVEQYYLLDKSIQSKLGINSIPRFMIIDPDGKMYNSKLALPGESNFTEVLKEIRNKQ